MKREEIIKITKWSSNVDHVKQHLQNSLSMIDFNKASQSDILILKDMFNTYRAINNEPDGTIYKAYLEKDVYALSDAQLREYLKNSLHRIDYKRVSDFDLDILKRLFERNRGDLPLGSTCGSDVIPKIQWIDINKTYTFKGKRVINMSMKLHLDDTNIELAYPIKGTVVVKEKPQRLEYKGWSLDGREFVHCDCDELVEVKNGK